MIAPLLDQPIDDPALNWAREHPALAVAGITTAVFLVKVMFVAHLNTPVALGIVASVGPAELATGMLALLFPTMTMLLAYVMWLATAVSYMRGRRAAVLFEASVLVSVFAVVTTPLGSLLLFLGVNSVAVAVVYWAWRRRAKKGGPPLTSYWPFIQWRLVGVGLSVVFLITAAPTPWLPAESYQVAGAEREQVGYFIEEDGHWVTVLRDDDRSLVRYREDEIERREVCALKFPRDVLATPIRNLIAGRQASLRECPAEPT